MQGVLRMGQEVEVRPGIVTKDAQGRAACLPIYSRIVSLKAEENALQYAVPGGLIGVGMTVRGPRDLPRHWAWPPHDSGRSASSCCLAGSRPHTLGRSASGSESFPDDFEREMLQLGSGHA